jgi:anti-sigma factor RsiW
MSATCAHPISWQDLVAYWADDLEPAAVERVDEHLMGCSTCSESSAGVAAITGALRQMIPPLISSARLAELRARGLRVAENPVWPGERKPVVFGREIDLLVHRLGGLDLARAESVRVTVSIEETGMVVRDDPNAPFDRAAGEVLVACQRHFASLPPNIVFEVRARGPLGEEPAARYIVPHTFS